MAVTIKDVAKRLQISPSTVSRALNNKPGISPLTVSAVSIMAKKMNYKPNSTAVNLRQHRSKCIGVILPSVASYFFSEAVAGIQEMASKNGYQVLILQTNDQEDEEKNAIQTVNSSRVDGVLISIGSEVKGINHIKALKKEMPIVLFDRTSKKLDLPSVGASDFSGAYDMTKYLIKSGRKTIVHLTGRKNLEIVQERLLGYKEALSDHGISYRRDLVVDCEFDENQVALAIIKLIASGTEFDAIFAANDRMGIQAILTLKAIGYDVPQHIAVAGFGNYSVSRIVRPTLTTISLQPREMGFKATKYLIKEIDGKRSKSEPKVKTELIIRDSA